MRHRERGVILTDLFRLPAFGLEARGGEPTLDLDPEDESDLLIIVPFFDKDGDGALEALEADPAVDVQCPEPGQPFSTCTMHPTTLELTALVAAAVAQALGVSLQDVEMIPLVNHSHVLRDTPGGTIPWDNFIALVTNPDIWPDKNGNCAAVGSCLTSVEAVQAAAASGDVFGGIVPSTLFLFFGVHRFHID